jgi:LPS export ABC transporter protein LptC
MASPFDFSRLTLFAGACATIAMALYLALYWDSNPATSLLTKRDPDRVDLYADQVHVTKYDAAGKLVQQLWATSMHRFPERGNTQLSAPKLQSAGKDALGKDGELWNTTAATGTLIGDEEVQLNQNVVVTDQAKTIRLDTEALHYFPDRQQASTDVAVKLSRFDDVTTAVGMRVDLNRRRIELLHQVQSIYVQPQQ